MKVPRKGAWPAIFLTYVAFFYGGYTLQGILEGRELSTQIVAHALYICIFITIARILRRWLLEDVDSNSR